VGGTEAAVGWGSGTTCTNCGQRKPDPEFVPEQNPSFVLAEVPVPPGKAPKKGANKVGKENSDKAPGPKQLKVWAEKHDVALVQYALAAGYPRLSVTGGKGKVLLEINRRITEGMDDAFLGYSPPKGPTILLRLEAIREIGV